MAAKSKSNIRLYLIDGSGYLFRAYFALGRTGALTRSDGTPVGAVLGFSNMLNKLLTDMQDEHDPTHLAVIFDHSGKSFRNEIYPEYKANRPEAPEDLIPQFPLVRDATRAFNVPCIELKNYEADDIIATYAKQVEADGGEVVIISSDKDLMQLVSDKVSMFDPIKNKKIGPEEVAEKFGLGPEHVIDIQALAGDSTDNVPGVPGIGVKTAAQLIEEYGDLETLLDKAEEIKQKKRRENLIEFAEQARVSKQLVELCVTAPVEEPVDDLGIRSLDLDLLLPFLEEMEFDKLIDRVKRDNGAAAPAPSPAAGKNGKAKYETIFDEQSLKAWIERARQRGRIAVDTETDSLNAMRANLVGVSLSTGRRRWLLYSIGARKAGGVGRSAG